MFVSCCRFIFDFAIVHSQTFFFHFLFKSVAVLKTEQKKNLNLLNTVFRITHQIKMFVFLLGLFLKKQNEVDIWTPSPLAPQH